MAYNLFKNALVQWGAKQTDEVKVMIGQSFENLAILPNLEDLHVDHVNRQKDALSLGIFLS